MKLAAAVVATLVPIAMHAADLKFAAAVEAEKYPSVAAPEQAPSFRWDFSARRDYVFRYEQTTEGRTRFSTDPEMLVSAALTGDLIVRSNADGTARLVLDKAEVKGSNVVDGKPHEISQKVPTTVTGTITEAGVVTSQAIGIQMLFPLPPAAFAFGQTVDVPFVLPYNASGSILQVKGVTHLKHAGYALLGKRLCARLEIRVETGTLDVPEEVSGHFDLTMSGTGVYFFDVVERRFVRGVLASRMTMTAESAAPVVAVDGESAKDAGPMKMSTANDERITVTIVE
jgi:hypothetical protein